MRGEVGGEQDTAPRPVCLCWRFSGVKRRAYQGPPPPLLDPPAAPPHSSPGRVVGCVFCVFSSGRETLFPSPFPFLSPPPSLSPLAPLPLLVLSRGTPITAGLYTVSQRHQRLASLFPPPRGTPLGRRHPVAASRPGVALGPTFVRWRVSIPLLTFWWEREWPPLPAGRRGGKNRLPLRLATLLRGAPLGTTEALMVTSGEGGGRPVFRVMMAHPAPPCPFPAPPPTTAGRPNTH